MPLSRHGRYRYSALPTRPAYDWPGGKRLAVYIALNLETFAFGEGLGARLALAIGEPDVLNFSWRDYGNRVGAWRLLDLFESHGLATSVLVNSSLCDEAPELITAIMGRGDEIVGHGRTNSERQGAMSEEEERALIADATERLRVATGQPPAGWLGPWISESAITPDLLAEAGYRYILDWAMDDQPVYLKVRGGGRLLAVPYPQELNDIPAIITRQASGAVFADMIVDSFDEMVQQSADAPLVMGIALHAYIVGQPHRLRPLRRALQHLVAARNKIWMTTAGQIADYCLSLPAGILPD
jgi:allantoinase